MFIESRNKMIVSEFDEYKLNFELHNDCMKCDKCPILESKVDELTKVVSNFESGTNKLNDMFGRQRYANDRSGLGFTNVVSSSKTTQKTKFIASTSKYDSRKTFALPPKKKSIKVS